MSVGRIMNLEMTAGCAVTVKEGSRHRPVWSLHCRSFLWHPSRLVTVCLGLYVFVVWQTGVADG